jgi:dienelactone hydrolase
VPAGAARARAPSRRRLSILVLGDDDRRHASCVLDHLHALELYSRHAVRLFNPVGLKSSRFLDLDGFDVVAIHYSLPVTSDHHLSPVFREKLSRFSGLKVLFAMDEYRQIDAITAVMRQIGIDVLFTCVPLHAIETVYGDRLPGVEIVPVLTGYVPDRLVGRAVMNPASRQVEIGYRGRSLPYWLGEFGQEKRRIGEGVLERAPHLGLNCDIEWSEAERIYGTAWDSRVASWRATLAVEAGSGVVDHDGSIQARTEAYVRAHPGAGFAEVRRAVLENDDGNVDFKVISSRVFEAIALRTALVMFPGQYSGVVRPGVHYLSLEPDFSNLDQVAAALRDIPSLEAMIERAYRDVVASGRYSYRVFVDTIEAVLERHLPVSLRNPPRRGRLLARVERFAKVKTAAAIDNAVRGALAASVVAREPDLRRLAWRYITALRDRPRVKPRRVLADLLKLHLLRRAQVGRLEPAAPFRVTAEFGPEGTVMFRSRASSRSQVGQRAVEPDPSAVEAAIRQGHLRTLSWDHSLVASQAALRLGNWGSLFVGTAGSLNRLDALASLAGRFPVEAAVALAPLFEGSRPAEPWTDVDHWAVANGARLDCLGFVRAFESADRKRRGRRPSAAAAPARPDAIRREQARVWRAQMRALELDVAAVRQAPHMVIEHDKVTQTHSGARYMIEVITWDAYPGMSVPAVVYRPVDARVVARPCVIVALGSQGNVATHGELYSAQRHAANLALRGFNVLVFASGLCFNGLNGERLDNSYAFETYGRLSGSGFTSRSIDVLMYLRAFDYMAGRADVDAHRIGATGYSYGGRMAYYLAAYEPRVAALGIAAAAVFTGGEDSDSLYSARRDAAMYTGTPDRFTNGEPERLHSESPLASALSDSVLLAPRPFRIVLGREDPGTSQSIAQQRIDRLKGLYAALDPTALAPEFVLVDGSHHFDASRRRIVEDWFACVLRSEPVLELSQVSEHLTPILERTFLERPPPGLGTLSTRKIHATRAVEAIAKESGSRWIDRCSPHDARQRLRGLLKMAPDVAPRAARPMLLDERGFRSGECSFSASFWLLPLSDHIDAAALMLTPHPERSDAATLFVLDGERLLPEHDTLRAVVERGNTALVVYLPGFGPLRSPQERLGDLAMRVSSRLDRTLLGLCVEAVEAGLDLLQSHCPGATVTAESHGVDAGNVIGFATALDERIACARVHEGVATFQRFFTSSVDAIPAPTLAIAGLAAQVDVPDLQRLAGDGRLRIESESDLLDYVVDLRPSSALN